MVLVSGENESTARLRQVKTECDYRHAYVADHLAAAELWLD